MEQMEHQKMIKSGTNKKNQNHDELIEMNSASVGKAKKAEDSVGFVEQNVPDGQKVY